MPQFLKKSRNSRSQFHPHSATRLVVGVFCRCASAGVQVSQVTLRRSLKCLFACKAPPFFAFKNNRRKRVHEHSRSTWTSRHRETVRKFKMIQNVTAIFAFSAAGLPPRPSAPFPPWLFLFLSSTHAATRRLDCDAASAARERQLQRCCADREARRRKPSSTGMGTEPRRYAWLAWPTIGLRSDVSLHRAEGSRRRPRCRMRRTQLQPDASRRHRSGIRSRESSTVHLAIRAAAV